MKMLQFALSSMAALMWLTQIESVQAGCADLPMPEVDWRRCFAADRDLRGADLTKANLLGATLNTSRLDGARLVGIDGRRAKFIDTKLQSAKLDGGELVEADFSRADLRQASLRGADLRRARFFRAQLQGADLSQAKIDGVDFLHADLSGALWIDGKTRCAANSIGLCQ